VAAEIRKWLEALGLEQYAETFTENDVDFRALPHLDQDDLKELGVSLGHPGGLWRRTSALLPGLSILLS
jgi:hypothetical protein